MEYAGGLKRCPFCGKDAHTFHIPENTKAEQKKHPFWEWKNGGMWAVGCWTSGCIGDINNVAMVFITEELAIEAWNRRANNGL